MLATGHGSEAQLWALATGKRLHSLAGPNAAARRMNIMDHATGAFAPDGRTLFVGETDGALRSWDVSSGKVLNTVQAHNGPVLSLALSRDGKFLATGGQDKTAKLWEAGSGRLLHTRQAHESYVQAVRFHPDGKVPRNHRLSEPGGSDRSVPAHARVVPAA
jgi:WD40 repeat protein